MNKNRRFNKNRGDNRNRNYNKYNRGGRNQQRNNYRNDEQIYAPKNKTQPDQLTEVEVGITEYLGNFEHFSGVIKARFSDFQVNEIDLNDEVAKFTETKIPDEFKLIKAEEPPKECPIEGLPQEKWDEVLNMMESKENDKVLIEVTEMDKEKRAALHGKFKNVFQEKIISTTIEKDGKKFIQLFRYTKDSIKRTEINKRWPENVGEYVHFLLFKENIDTMEALSNISYQLHLPMSIFNFAGTKDRRAKTTQWVSCYKVEPFKLLIKTKPVRNVRVGNLKFKEKPLKLGMLKGNQFRIALRNVTAQDDLINKSMSFVKENGFINYYGLQRFGNHKEVPTFEIGKKLLIGNFREACNLILKPKKHEDLYSDLYKAKQIYQETSDAGKACEIFKEDERPRSIEGKLLRGLAESGQNDYVNALERMPRNMRLLYIHSFQSYVWNHIVSERVKKYGLKPVVGDLVLMNDAEPEAANLEFKLCGDDCDKTNDAIAENESIEEEQEVESVKVLTQEDLENYTIYDIVLPLPGYKVTYPENDLKNYYKSILEKHGLALEMTPPKVKSYGLKGNYRKIISQARDLSWYCLKYNDPNCNLIRSDFEELLGHKEPEDVQDGKYKSLIINVKLSSASYATMLLREILKTDTSNQSQRKLNDYHILETKTEEPEVVKAEEESLLCNKSKFEDFKKAIFNVVNNADVDEDESKKRKAEGLEESSQKKLKTNETNGEEIGIKVQASLV